VPDFGHRLNDFPGHADSFPSVVSRHVLGDHPEEWGKRVGTATRLGLKWPSSLSLITGLSTQGGPKHNLLGLPGRVGPWRESGLLG
jgi:hypothetical protein